MRPGERAFSRSEAFQLSPHTNLINLKTGTPVMASDDSTRDDLAEDAQAVENATRWRVVDLWAYLVANAVKLMWANFAFAAVVVYVGAFLKPISVDVQVAVVGCTAVVHVLVAVVSSVFKLVGNGKPGL